MHDSQNFIRRLSHNLEVRFFRAVKRSGKNVAVLNAHLYRPFEYDKLADILPQSVEKVIVLDRTKECGARDPLFLDVTTALKSRPNIKVLGGRYGLGGKEFTPAMVQAVIKNFETQKDDFTVVIDDDVNFSSLPIEQYKAKDDDFEIKIFGLGSDGSVSASKNAIKILGNALNKNVQGYFEYVSKKSGSLTRSHLRVADREIKSAYLVQEPNIVMINNFSFVHQYDCLQGLQDKGTVLINSIFSADEIDKVLPDVYKTTLQQKHAKLFVINAQKLATKVGLGNKINMIMQTALFKAANMVDFDLAYAEIQKYITKTFAKKGQKVVDKNLLACELTVQEIEEVDVKKLKLKNIYLKKKENTDEFYNKIMRPIEQLSGDNLTVSAFDKAGKVPQGTAEFEKRGIADNLPMWLPANCSQCGHCVIACPHNAIKPILTKAETPAELEFAKAYGMNGYFYRLQVSPEDCVGCGACVDACIAQEKALKMTPASEIFEEERKKYYIAKNIPSEKTTLFTTDLPKRFAIQRLLFWFFRRMWWLR